MPRWKLLRSELVLDSPWLRLYRNAYRNPNGGEVPDYYILERSAFVLVVASDGEDVVLVRQYRPATDEVYLSLPAGYIQEPESPQSAALRELWEETSVRASTCAVLGELHPLPGYINSPAFVVLCSGLQGSPKVVDTDEIDSVVRIPWGQALTKLRDGSIREMQAVAALLLARLHLSRE